jgi:predicted Rossmann fold flavoprotein
MTKDSMSKPGVLVIGGGASGLAAAIASARHGAAVTLLEADARVGRKILASGNGRCNLTNVAIDTAAYNQPAFVEPIVQAYPCDSVLGFFSSMGLLTSSDDEGRVYPASNAAASVLDVLRLECDRLDIDVRHEFKASGIASLGSDGWEVTSDQGATVRGSAVVVATGGGTLLESVGHTMVATQPVLGPIRTETEPIRGLSGVRVRCAATLFAGVSQDARVGHALATERGELLFRDYGVSGIMIFDLSRALVDGCALSIDFFPDLETAELTSLIAQRCDTLSDRTGETFFAGMLHDRVAKAVLRTAGVSMATRAAALPQERLVAILKDFRLKVAGRGDASQSQVTRGGAAVSEFDPSTMASLKTDGLFAAGEVLDVDGRSGGYNLHWAWASGIVAGESAARAATAMTQQTNPGRTA